MDAADVVTVLNRLMRFRKATTLLYLRYERGLLSIRHYCGVDMAYMWGKPRGQ